MSERESDAFSVKRVIAALEACSHDMEVLPMAVDIAARLGAEVCGLFVEDENLLRLCALPAARHVTLSAALREPPNLEQIERELRALAARAEAILGAAASRQHVPWSFRVLRGQLAEELDEATMMQDLLVVGPTRELAGLPFRLTSPLEDAVRRLARSTLHLPRQTTLAKPVVVVRAGSALVERTLAAAIRLADPRRREFDLWIVGTPAESASAQPGITRQLEELGCRARIRLLDPSSVTEPRRALVEARGDVLVIAADVPLFRDHDDVLRYLEHTGTPVMIVR